MYTFYKLHQTARQNRWKLHAGVVIRPVNFVRQTFSAAVYALPAKLI